MLLSLYSLFSRVNGANGDGRGLLLEGLYVLRLLICWAAEELVISAANAVINQVALALGSIAAGVLISRATNGLGWRMTENLRPWIARQLRLWLLILVRTWPDKCFQKVTIRVGSQAVH